MSNGISTSTDQLTAHAWRAKGLVKEDDEIWRKWQVSTYYLDVVSRSSSQLMTTPSTRGLYESARCMGESILEGFIEFGVGEK